MKPKPESKGDRKAKSPSFPYRVSVGNATVTIYRTIANGYPLFMVADKTKGKGQRRLVKMADFDAAKKYAESIAGALSRGEALVAQLRPTDVASYGRALELLRPTGASIELACANYAKAVEILGGDRVIEAAQCLMRMKPTAEEKLVAEAVEDLLSVKEGRGASVRYLQDLRSRLGQFAAAFKCNASSVATADIQAWLDGLKLEPQGYVNFRRVVHLLFQFAVARGYATDNPVEGVERVKVNGGEIEIFTPAEIMRLLGAATPDFLPCIALGAFAGLRSAEIERLEWSDVDLVGGHITVGASKSKTAGRRIVPLHPNLAQWLAPYAEQSGMVWKGTHEDFYERQQQTAAATEIEADSAKSIKAMKPVKWKANGLRHSYASYRFAQTSDAGRVAGELGNSAAVVHKHYRELVKPPEAARWFSIKPGGASNVLLMAQEGA